MNNLSQLPIGFAKKVSKRGLLGLIGFKDRLVVIGYADKKGVQRKAWAELSERVNPYALSTAMGWVGSTTKDMLANKRARLKLN